MLGGVSMGASSVFQPWELSEVRVLVAVLSCACVADAMLTPCGGGGGTGAQWAELSIFRSLVGRVQLAELSIFRPVGR